MEFFLFRHGETNWNTAGLIKGQLDDSGIEFTENGQKQLRWIAEHVSGKGISAIFSSDLCRTAETARYINQELHLPLHLTPNFRGLNLGIYQGMPTKEFRQTEEFMAAFSDYDHVLPGGESVNQLRERFLEGLKQIRDTFSYDKVLIIAHRAAISNVYSHVTRSPYKDLDYCILKTDGNAFYSVSAGRYKS